MSKPDKRIGTKIADKYLIKGVLGKGGMGVVYAAVHELTEGEVAIKTLHANYAQEDSIRKRFFDEAKAASRIKGRNVIQIIDMGVENDEIYLVMERLTGESLRSRLKRGPLSVMEAIDLLTPVMDALTTAHNKSIVHRDLKPDNIHLHKEEDGTIVPKLLDFGIAKIRSEAAESGTATGSMLGTPWYMSPEQTRGKKDLGPPSDVWSMAVVFYVAVSGKMPYDAESARDALFVIGGGTPMRPLKESHPDLPDLVCDIIDSALVYKPERRPTMEELASRLRAAGAQLGTAVYALPTGRVQYAGPAVLQVPTGAPSRPGTAAGMGSYAGGPATGSHPSQPGLGTYPSQPSQPGLGSHPSQPGLGSYPSQPGAAGPHAPTPWATPGPPSKKSSPVLMALGLVAVIGLTVVGTIFLVKELIVTAAPPVTAASPVTEATPPEPPPQQEATAETPQPPENGTAQAGAGGGAEGGSEGNAGEGSSGETDGEAQASAGSEGATSEADDSEEEEEGRRHHRRRNRDRDDEDDGERSSSSGGRGHRGTNDSVIIGVDLPQ